MIVLRNLGNNNGNGSNNGNGNNNGKGHGHANGGVPGRSRWRHAPITPMSRDGHDGVTSCKFLSRHVTEGGRGGHV